MFFPLTRVCSADRRLCGKCSACCKTHFVEDPALIKPSGQWCLHRRGSRGCAIYEHRPDACQRFRCEWLKGVGGIEHRPDRTGVVLDYVTSPNFPEGLLQMWEATDNSLLTEYAQSITHYVLQFGIFVFHLYLSGRKALFTPEIQTLTDEMREAAEREGIELLST